MKSSRLKPLISIIVAVLNGEKTLQRCIDSISSQTYSQKQLIIIDGGSTDGTTSILGANNDKLAYWESGPDRGIYHAWNKGLDHANGDWICFLGSDDRFWQTDVLERMAQFLTTASPDVRVAYGQAASVTEQGEVLSIAGKPWDTVKRRFTQDMCIPHPGLMHRRSLFEVHGNFDESFRIAGDYELLLRELKSANALYVPGVIVVGRQYGGISSSPKNAIRTLKEGARARRMNGVKAISPRWIMRYSKAILRILLRLAVGEDKVRYLAILYGRLTRRPSLWEKILVAREAPRTMDRQDR